MYGPQNTAADIAFLLEEGLRTGTVSLHDEKQGRQIKLSQKRWIALAAQRSIALFAREFLIVVLTIAVISAGHFLIEPAGLVSVKGILGILLCAFLVFLYGLLCVALAKARDSARTPYKS
jgi:hypothetical protein